MMEGPVEDDAQQMEEEPEAKPEEVIDFASDPSKYTFTFSSGQPAVRCFSVFLWFPSLLFEFELNAPEY